MKESENIIVAATMGQHYKRVGAGEGDRLPPHQSIKQTAGQGGRIGSAGAGVNQSQAHRGLHPAADIAHELMMPARLVALSAGIPM